jgi:hypothetical protein
MTAGGRAAARAQHQGPAALPSRGRAAACVSLPQVVRHRLPEDDDQRRPAARGQIEATQLRRAPHRAAAPGGGCQRPSARRTAPRLRRASGGASVCPSAAPFLAYLPVGQRLPRPVLLVGLTRWRCLPSPIWHIRIAHWFPIGQPHIPSSDGAGFHMPLGWAASLAEHRHGTMRGTGSCGMAVKQGPSVLWRALWPYTFPSRKKGGKTLWEGPTTSYLVRFESP